MRSVLAAGVAALAIGLGGSAAAFELPPRKAEPDLAGYAEAKAHVLYCLARHYGFELSTAFYMAEIALNVNEHIARSESKDNDGFAVGLTVCADLTYKGLDAVGR